MKRFLAATLLVALLLTSLCGCDVLESIFNKKQEENKKEEAPTEQKHVFTSQDCDEDFNYDELVPTVGLSYVLSDDGTYYSVIEIAKCKDEHIVVPATYNGLPVKEICGGNAPWNFSTRSITIPDSVTYISPSALSITVSVEKFRVDKNNPSYKTIDGNLYNKSGFTLVNYAAGKREVGFVIPEGVLVIGEYAFNTMLYLKSITLPLSLTTIKQNAFIIAPTLIEIVNNSYLDIEKGSLAFAGIACNAIDVHHGESRIAVKDDFAFYTYGGVNYLVGYVGNETSIVLPQEYNGAKYEIGKYAFYNHFSLESIRLSSGVTAIGDFAFSTCAIKEFVISEGVTKIGKRVFENCFLLRSVTVPTTVSNIGDGVFDGCVSLMEIVNNSSIQDFGVQGLYNSVKISSESNRIVSVGDYQFYTSDGVNYLVGYTGNDQKLILPTSYNGEDYVIATYAFVSILNIALGNGAAITEVVIPDSVTEICACAFEGLYNLSHVEMPDSVTEIGDYAFYYCESLTSISIPNSVISIGDYAFAYCYSLTNIIIPDSVTSIGDCAFAYCYSLTSLTIGSGVASISASALLTSYRLVSLTIDEDNPYYQSINGDVYSKDGKSILIFASGKTKVLVPEYVTEIGDDAFGNYYNGDHVAIYYAGTRDEWREIKNGDKYESRSGIVIFYYSEEEPTEYGRFWHYVDGEMVAW